MKVLLINPLFPFSFWSFPEGCKLLGAKALHPPLGLITVAALLPQKWRFRLRDLNTTTLSEEDWSWAELVVITGMFVQQEGIIAIIKEAKSRRKKTVVGGSYATTMPDEVLAASCDYLVIGEAELCIKDFLEALKQGNDRKTFQSDQKPDMALSPVPRFDLLNTKDYANISIQTSRGCPYNCTGVYQYPKTNHRFERRRCKPERAAGYSRRLNDCTILCRFNN